MRNIISAHMSVIVVVFLWHMIVAAKVFSVLLVPAPYAVAHAVAHIIVTSSEVKNIFATLLRCGAGLMCGVVCGVGAGYLIGSSARVRHVLAPWLDFLRSIPQAVLIFPLVLFLGIGESTKIILVIITVSLVMVVSVVGAIDTSSPVRRALALSLGFTRRQLIFRVVLPEALPQLSSGFKIAISFAVIITIVSEMLTGTHYGIGRAIQSAQLTYETAMMYAYIFIAGLVGYSANTFYMFFERRYIHWAGK